MATSKFPLQEQETLSIKPVGLWTYPNPISAVPQGALKSAMNTVIDRPSVIEQRRGEAPFGTVLPEGVDKFYNFQNRLIIHHGTAFSYDSDSFGTWVDYTGSFIPPSNALTIHSVLANKNIYFSTNAGIKKLDLLTNQITFSGAPAGLDGSGVVTGSGWFPDSTQVAYRIIFGYNDANGNLILGAPSQRIVVANSSGAVKNVQLTFTLPAGLTTDWFYQIYRSPTTVDLLTEPNDECALVYTGHPTAGELTAHAVTVIDNTDDSLKGAMIYTASSQQGIAQANIQPPLATDMTVFKGFTFYSNTTDLQQFFLTLVVVGSPNGVQVGDTITINGTAFTGQAAENIAAQQFQVYTAGTPSQNITNTANSLVRVINRYSGNTTIYAYYESGYSDTPGKILLEARDYTVAQFSVISSRGAAWVPNLTTAQLSSNNQEPNAIYISKFQQPEAAPTLQKVNAGAADKSILRIIALRDYILIFKQDGVFEIAGSDLSSFQVIEVDKTTIIRGIETAVALNNKVFFFSNQTVVSLTFNEGAILKSLPIKKDLLVLSSPLYPNFDSVSYGVAYESDNKYILGTISTTVDTAATHFYVYNYLTDAWTEWQFTYPMKSGFVNPTDGKLYLGSASLVSPYVYQERKNYTEFDYADESYPATIVSATNYIVQVTDTTGFQVGWSLSQNNQIALITGIPDSTHLVVNKILTWSVGAALIYAPIHVQLEFLPESMGNPGLVKHFKEVHVIFSSADFSLLNLKFATDFSASTSLSLVSLVPTSNTGWGLGGWGEFPWGSGAPELQIIRTYVPLTQRRGHWLKLLINYAEAGTNFALDGFTFYYQSTSQKFH